MSIKEPIEKNAETSSGIEMKPVLQPSDAEVDYERDLNDPGEFPYTRGPYKTMYRGKLWTMRQYAGFASAAESNARYRYLLEQGQGRAGQRKVLQKRTPSLLRACGHRYPMDGLSCPRKLRDL